MSCAWTVILGRAFLKSARNFCSRSHLSVKYVQYVTAPVACAEPPCGSASSSSSASTSPSPLLTCVRFTFVHLPLYHAVIDTRGTRVLSPGQAAQPSPPFALERVRAGPEPRRQRVDQRTERAVPRLVCWDHAVRLAHVALYGKRLLRLIECRKDSQRDRRQQECPPADGIRMSGRHDDQASDP